MKHQAAIPFTFAAVTALSAAMLMSPASAQTSSQPQSGVMQQSQAAPAGTMSSGSATQAETMDMVSARVAVTAGLDANKAKPGDQVTTRLAKKVTLKDGKELPAGTRIVGVVATDEMHTNGASRLALDFNKAELKDGTSIPIKATIVGVYGAEWQDMEGNPMAPGDQITGAWTGHPGAVDEIGALPGVDLHSKVTSQNSGVLVSSSGRDVKLKSGTEIALAVAPAQGM